MADKELKENADVQRSALLHSSWCVTEEEWLWCVLVKKKQQPSLLRVVVDENVQHGNQHSLIRSNSEAYIR